MNKERLFNKNIKFLRKLKKVSQQELADYLKVDRSTISRWESNEMDSTIGYAIKCSEYFNVPINILIGEDMESMEEVSVEQVIKDVKMALSVPNISDKRIEYLKNTLEMLEGDSNEK